METFSTEELQRNQSAFEQQVANVEPQVEQKNTYSEPTLPITSDSVVEIPLSTINLQDQTQAETQVSSNQESQVALDESPELLFSTAEHNPTEENLERLAVSSHA